MKNFFPRTIRPGDGGAGDGGAQVQAPPRPAPAAGRPGRPRTAQTQFAMRALGLAERFSQVCGVHRLEGVGCVYHLELATPEGPSTGGGKQAVQHIKLVPDSGTTIVIGQANQVEGRAELRSFECLARLHAARFKGASLPFEREPYEKLAEKVTNFLGAFQLKVATVDNPPTTTSPSMIAYGVENTDKASRFIIAAAGIALVALLFLLLKR